MSASSPARRTRHAILMAPLFAIAVLWVLLDDLFRSVVVPAVNGLARLRLLKRLEALVAMLPPYPTMALFVIPLAIIEPFKIYGLYLIGTGHLFLGILAFVAAKVVGIGLAERLFAISRDKLLSIRWFARLYDKTIAVKDAVHAYLRRTRFWPAFVRALGQIRAFIRGVKERLREGARAAKAWVGGAAESGEARGPLGRRFITARRTVALYLHPERRQPLPEPPSEEGRDRRHPPLSKPAETPF